MRLVRKLIGCRFTEGNLVRFTDNRRGYVFRVAEIRFVNNWEVRLEDCPLWLNQDNFELVYRIDNSHLYQKVRAWEKSSRKLKQLIRNLKA